MGCCNSNSTFRFKGYVVDVYPPEEDGEPNVDALGKLKAYVGKNPERIPKVCRKVSKLTTAHLEKKRVNNARIGVLIIHDLIEDSLAVDYFVPHTVDLVMMLQSHEDEDLRISACALVAILTHKISDRPQYEPSRRSLASVQTDMIQFLEKMATDGMGTTEVLALHCRYAALVSLGNLFRCLRSSLVDNVMGITHTTLENLHDEMKRHSVSGSDGGNTPYSPVGRESSLASDHFITECPLLNGDESKLKQQLDSMRSVELPNQNVAQKDAAYHSACIALLMALATSCGNATVGDFISNVCRFMDSSGGWFTERMAEDTFKAIAIALQRKQQLGFSVCQKLLDLVVEHPPDNKLEAVLKVVTSVIAILPLNGVRPMLCMDAFSTVLRSPSHRDGVYSAVILAVEAVAKRAADQNNIGQLLRTGLELCQSINRTQHNVSVCVGLDALKAAAPHLSTLTLTEKLKLKMVSTLRPFLSLNSREDLHIKQKAAACIAAYFGGPPTLATTIPGIGAGALPEELEFITSWLQSLVVSDDSLMTPSLLIETVNVVRGLLKVAGYSILPWVFDTMLFDVQTKLAGVEGDSGRPSEKAGSQWTLMWHLFALGVLRAVGEVFRINDLIEFSDDIMKRRKSPDAGEVPQGFIPRFETTTSGIGLRTTSHFEDVVYTRVTAETDGTAPAVKSLISRKTAATYLCKSGNMAQLMDAFQCDTDEAVRDALEGQKKSEGGIGDSPTSLNGALLRASSIRAGDAAGISPLVPGKAVVEGVTSRGLPSATSLGELELGSTDLLSGGFGFEGIQEFSEPTEDQLHVVAGPNSLKASKGISFAAPTIQEELKSYAAPTAALSGSEQKFPEPIFTLLARKRSLSEPQPSSMNSRLSANRCNESIASIKTATSMMTNPGPLHNHSITSSRAKALRTPGVDLSGLASTNTSLVAPATPRDILDPSSVSVGFAHSGDDDVLNSTVSDLAATTGGDFDLI